MIHLFCNWNFVPLDLPHLLISSATPSPGPSSPDLLEGHLAALGGPLWDLGSEQSPPCLGYPKCAQHWLQEAILPWMRIQDPVLGPLRLAIPIGCNRVKPCTVIIREGGHCGFKIVLKLKKWGFPGGAVVKNPPANAGDTGSSPGPGRSHMLRSN